MLFWSDADVGIYAAIIISMLLMNVDQCNGISLLELLPLDTASCCVVNKIFFDTKQNQHKIITNILHFSHSQNGIVSFDVMNIRPPTGY